MVFCTYKSIHRIIVPFAAALRGGGDKRNPVGIRDSHLYCNADEKADPLAVCREGALEEDAKSGYPLRSIFGMKK